ncbi:hypothetical protein CISIN_1g042493mg [Citrus sinensis]|uniref:Uncharacterized protein n=1 Tax=Citrus sinensis TaxID=2711 RepID=A0A067D6Z5_CITSI|nr:hypothetical protein CISIN_1g042493mg [Citrus sinensis]
MAIKCNCGILILCQHQCLLFLTVCIRLLVRTDEEYQRFAAFVCLLVRLEQSMGKDTRSIWERLLKICGTMLEAWQSYISMEIELGHTGTGSGVNFFRPASLININCLTM